MSATPQSMVPLRRLLKRSEFLSAARGQRAGRASFGLQAAPSSATIPGVGFTVTKKTGNSPERNRIKRRLRAAVATCATDFQPQHDYVLIGRRDALSTPFATLIADLEYVLHRIHDPKARRAGPNAPKGIGSMTP